MTEKWLPHPEWAELEVSDAGRLRRRINLRHPERNKPYHFYRGHPDKDGYLKVIIRKIAERFVHRIVYRVHVGPVPEGKVVCHLNGNNTDNRVQNLSAVTQKENISHKAQHGTAQRGEKHPLCKYPDKLVRRVLAEKGSMADTARKLNIPYHFVADVKRGKRGLTH